VKLESMIAQENIENGVGALRGDRLKEIEFSFVKT